MTIVLEDGTGVAGANSYASVTRAGAYHYEHGTSAEWMALVESADPTALLVEATRRLDATYSRIGLLINTTQGLSSPRQGVYDRDGREINVAAQMIILGDAASLLALRLYQDRVYQRREIKSESLPDYSVTYADDVGYPELDAIMAPLIDSGALGRGFGQSKLRRWS